MKVSIVQGPSVLLDRAASIRMAIAHIFRAASAGSGLVVFPEAYLGGYPAWIWYLKALEDAADLARLYTRFCANALDVEAGDLGEITAAARDAGVSVVVGFNEIERLRGGTTVYNSVAIIDAQGGIRNVHRKLMPTGPERTVWGQGDARGLRVVDLDGLRVGALICWENYMPLARAALYGQGLDLLVAPTWDHGDTWIATMRHIAKEGACWVIGTATSLRPEDIADSIPGKARWVRDKPWLCRGDAVLVNPFGVVAEGPAAPDLELVTGELTPETVRKARHLLDVNGHYSRPDVFTLNVDRSRRQTSTFTGDGAAGEPG